MRIVKILLWGGAIGSFLTSFLLSILPIGLLTGRFSSMEKSAMNMASVFFFGFGVVFLTMIVVVQIVSYLMKEKK